jgi:hypothetical protein
MTNSKTIDRADVAHPTNPIGGNGHIEEARTTLAEPLDPDAAKLPAGGGDAAVTGMPRSVREDLPDIGLPDGVPPARTGPSGDTADAPQERSERQHPEGEDPERRDNTRLERFHPKR